MMLGRARVSIRYGRALTALTRLILLALMGLVAALGLNASTAHARIAGRGRLIGTGSTAGQRRHLRGLSFIDATIGARDGRARRYAGLIDLITVALGSALGRSRTPIIAATQTPALGLQLRRC